MTDTRTALAELVDAASRYVAPRRTTDARQHLLQSLDAARAALAAPAECNDEPDCVNAPWCRIQAKCLKAPPAQPEPALSPSEAVYAFAGWLTCRDEAVTMGSTHNAAVAADLVDAFCESQHLEPPRQKWNNAIKPYPWPAAPPPPAQPARTVCAYPDCKCPTENPCLQGLPDAQPALTDEQIDSIASADGWHMWVSDIKLEARAFARLIERAVREQQP